jgi:hypothetical protein
MSDEQNSPNGRFDFLVEGGEQDGQHVRLDPLATVTHDFPFDEIAARLDGEHPRSLDYGALGSALIVLLDWVCQPCQVGGASTSVTTVARRALAARYIIGPAFFSGTPSLEALSLRLGLNRGALSETASKFTARFGVRTRVQSKGRNGRHRRKLRVRN